MRFVYHNTLLHVYTAPTKGCRLRIFMTQLHKTDPHTKGCAGVVGIGLFDEGIIHLS